MSESGEYSLPDSLQQDKSTHKFYQSLIILLLGDEEDQRQHQKGKEEQFIDIVKNKLTVKDAKELAMQAAIGKVRIPQVIPPQLTGSTMKEFWTFSDIFKLRSLYVLFCSSLYYEVLARKINPRKGKQIADRIYHTFRSNRDIMQDKDLFTRNFAGEFNEHRSQTIVPEQLQDILDTPLLVREEFNRFFAHL